ncbi:hypothetical protein [Sphingomonas montana]|uniref:hypothetical protein n=1 Tax=Sphingomonas montana TaxID=1843236 RepID=UPI001F0A6A33|nr:hypothetical protein [Sphingomonas montana]
MFAAIVALGIPSGGIWPGARSHCEDGGCVWTMKPALLLEEDDRASVMASGDAERAFDAHVARPIVRLGLVGVDLVESGPFAMLLLGVGLALRRLGGRGEGTFARALPWLRRASIAAILWAIARPVSDSLMAMLLAPGTPSGARWQVSVDLVEVGTALMLAIAAYATVWALEAGVRTQQDLAEIV